MLKCRDFLFEEIRSLESIFYLDDCLKEASKRYWEKFDNDYDAEDALSCYEEVYDIESKLNFQLAERELNLELRNNLIIFGKLL